MSFDRIRKAQRLSQSQPGGNEGGGQCMQDQSNDAFRQLMQDAAFVGVSEREIVACFSEWLLMDCWRFDGKDFHIFGNFAAADDIAHMVEEEGQVSFQGKFSDKGREIALAQLSRALETKGLAVTHYPLKVDDVPSRDFLSIGEYRPLADGSDGMIGVAFEFFRPLRQVSVSEGSTNRAIE